MLKKIVGIDADERRLRARCSELEQELASAYADIEFERKLVDELGHERNDLEFERDNLLRERDALERSRESIDVQLYLVRSDHQRATARNEELGHLLHQAQREVAEVRESSISVERAVADGLARQGEAFVRRMESEFSALREEISGGIATLYVDAIQKALSADSSRASDASRVRALRTSLEDVLAGGVDGEISDASSGDDLDSLVLAAVLEARRIPSKAVRFPTRRRASVLAACERFGVPAARVSFSDDQPERLALVRADAAALTGDVLARLAPAALVVIVGFDRPEARAEVEATLHEHGIASAVRESSPGIGSFRR